MNSFSFIYYEVKIMIRVICLAAALLSELLPENLNREFNNAAMKQSVTEKCIPK